MASQHFDAILTELPALINESDLHISQVGSLFILVSLFLHFQSISSAMIIVYGIYVTLICY